MERVTIECEFMDVGNEIAIGIPRGKSGIADEAVCLSPTSKLVGAQNGDHFRGDQQISILRDEIDLLVTDLGFLFSKVSAQSLRAASEMIILVSKDYPNIIQMLGCWCSDKIFCYLHLTAKPIMENFAAKIINDDYMAPQHLLPCH